MNLSPEKCKNKKDVLSLDWKKNPTSIWYHAGVYMIVNKKTREILYIGQATNLGHRLRPSTHPVFKREKHDVYIIFESDRNERRNMEWAFIQLVKPSVNIRNGIAPNAGKEEFLNTQYDLLFNK